ncbi:hypothetical protein ABZ570_32315 [Micromonospora sp. NPDC007271]|uniref:hypothetical protein n=1 Tax=Micromonospora sp. NPDC007271 TaxID=3154587 RepID=UPI0033FCD67C
MKNSAGQVVRIESYPECFPDSQGEAPDLSQIGACLAKDNLHQTVTYHPASHYWLLQWMETGIFLVLAGALAGTCFWWIRRRQN